MDIQGNVTFGKSETIADTAFMAVGESARMYVKSDSTLTLHNCLIEPTVLLSGGPIGRKAVLFHCSNKNENPELFPTDGHSLILPDSTSLENGLFDVRYSRIHSNLDGIVPIRGTQADPNVIYRNWIKGCGVALPTGNPDDPFRHVDGIQINKDGHVRIEGNRIEGWGNACIIIGGALSPSDGSDIPPSYITIKDNFFGAYGLAWFYLTIIPKYDEAVYPYGARPRFVSITGNWFESHNSFVHDGRALGAILSGTDDQNRNPAIFVRTEEEREEGIARQNLYPDVLAYRKQLKYPGITSKLGVDAASWIVWNQNYWYDTGEEANPTGSGWYDLSGERALFPVESGL